MKKGIFRTAIIFIVITVIGLGLVYLGRTTRALSRIMKTYVESELRKAFRREVTIDKISTNIINRVTISNVAIASERGLSEGAILACQKVTVSYNPLRILLGKRDLGKSIIKVVFKSPHLFLTNRMGEWNFLLPLSFQEASPPATFPDIVISDGTVTIEDVKQRIRKIEITDVSGILAAREKSHRLFRRERSGRSEQLSSEVYFYFSGKSNQSRNDKIRLKGTYSRERAQLSVNLNIFDLDLAGYSSLFLSDPTFTVLTGEGNLYLDLNMALNEENYSRIAKIAKSTSRGRKRLEDFAQIVSFSGELGLAELSCRWLSHKVEDVRGSIVFDNHRIGTQGISLRYKGLELKLGGGMERYLSQPVLGLTLSADLGLSKLPEIINVNELNRLLPLEGRARMSVGISGSLSDPKVDGWFLLPRAKIAGRPAEEFQGQFTYQNSILRILDLHGKIYEGTMAFSGKIDIERPYVDLEYALRDIDLGTLLPPDWSNKAKGKGSIFGNIFGEPLKLQANGKTDLKEVEFLGASLGDVSGFLNYTKGELEIEAHTSENNYQLNTALFLSRDAVKISRLELSAPERARVVLTGQIGLLGQGKLELKVVDSYMEVGKPPWLAQPIDRLSGRVDFLGKIGGTIYSPEVSGKVWSTSLKLMEENIKFDSEIYYGERILRVTSFKLNDVYSGDLTARFDGRIPVVSGAVETRDGDLKLVSTLFSGRSGRPAEVEGTLSGKIDFSNLSLGNSWWEKIKAKGTVSILQPRVGRLSFDELALGFKINEQGLSVDRFRFSRGTGEVRGSAKMGMMRRGQNVINIDSQWRNFPVNLYSWKPISADTDSQRKLAISRGRFRGNRVSGSLNFRGKLMWATDWGIDGSFSGKDFEYDGESVGPISANLSLNRELAHFSSFQCGSDLKGDFKIELAGQKTVTGGIEVNTTNVPRFVRLVFGSGRDKRFLSYLNEIKGNLYSKVLFAGLLENPQINGYLDIEKGIFSSTNFLFKSTFSYDEKEINLESAELNFAPGGAVIARGKIGFDEIGPLEIDAVLKDLDLSSVQGLFHHNNLKTFGKINGNFKLRGVLSRPRLKVELESQNTGVNGFQVDAIKADFRAEKFPSEAGETVELVFDSFLASFGQSLLRLAPESKIRFSLSEKSVDFSLLTEVRNINFAKLSIFGGAKLSGTASLSAKSPALKAMFNTRDLWVNRRNFENVKLNLSYEDRKLFFLPVAKETFQVLGEIDFERLNSFNVKLLEFFQGKERLVTVTGKADLFGPINLTVRAGKGKVPASLVAELLNVRTPLKGNSGFDLRLSRTSIGGRKERLYESLWMEGKVDVASGSIGNLLFDDLNAVFKADGGIMSLEELIINKKGEYAIKCWGTIPYLKEGRGGRGIDFSLQIMDSKAGVLRVLSREISAAKGELDALLHITGTSEEPLVNGYFRMEKGTIYCRTVLKRIDDLSCDISVKDSNILINRINGRIEKGEMDLKGKVALAGWMPDEFDVVFANTAGHGIPLKVPFLKIPQSSFFGRPLSEVPCSLELKGKIHAYGTLHSYNLEGAIELENTHFTYPPRAEDTKDLNLDFLKPAVWNLEINAGKNTWYENTFAEVQVQGEMRLTGPTKDLTVNGALTAIKGEMNYLGAAFTVKEATVECINDELFLEVRAECPIEDDTIMLVVERGRWGKVKPKFISRNDPEMSQEEALVRATGLDSLKLSPQEGDALLRRELLKLIDSSLASPLIKSILKSTGLVDVVKIDASLAQKAGERLTSGEDGEGKERSSLLEGTRITLGKYLSNNFYLSYKMQFEEGFLNKLELRHEVELLYRLKRGTSLKGKLGEEERYFGVERQIRF